MSTVSFLHSLRFTSASLWIKLSRPLTATNFFCFSLCTARMSSGTPATMPSLENQLITLSPTPCLDPDSASSIDG